MDNVTDIYCDGRDCTDVNCDPRFYDCATENFSHETDEGGFSASIEQ